MSDTSFGSIVFPVGAAGNHIRWLLFLDDKFPNPFNCDKMQFIKKNVYCEERSWNNWLQYEWKYRDHLNPVIEISHVKWDWERVPEGKQLYLTFNDVDLPYNHYLHINLGLNCADPEHLKNFYQEWINEFEIIKQRIHEFPNKKIVHSDTIFQGTLSRELYQDIVNFYGFSDNYESANLVHQWYTACRKKSLEDFYKYFTSESFLNTLDSIRKSY